VEPSHRRLLEATGGLCEPGTQGPNGIFKLTVELLTPLLARRPFISKQDHRSPVHLGSNSREQPLGRQYRQRLHACQWQAQTSRLHGDAIRFVVLASVLSSLPPTTPPLLRGTVFPRAGGHRSAFCKDGNELNPARGIIYSIAPPFRIVSSSCSSEPRVRSCDASCRRRTKKNDKPSYRNPPPTSQRSLAGVTELSSRCHFRRVYYPANLPESTATGK
jgi:hypothetical protein